MPQISDLTDLLKHEILDLYSAEEQIIDALPKMIDKATNAELKKSLRDHLKVTEEQKTRLDEIKRLMGDKENAGGSKEKKGFFSKLFGGSGGEKCKGTEGLIKEGEKMMGEDMTTEVMDAAIIGAAQKIEHYEISGYGTAVAYARELSLSNVAGLLQQTLDEEYAADDSLTKLAVGKLNIKAEDPAPTSPKKESQRKAPEAAPSPKSNIAKSNKNSQDTSSTVASKSSVSKGSVSKGSVSKGSVSKGSVSKGNLSKKNSPKSSPGNTGAVKSVSKSAGKRSVKGRSKSNTKSGKSKSSKRR